MIKELSLPALVMLFLLASLELADADFTKDSALQAINDAASVIQEMQNMKFGVTYANDTLNEAKALFLQERYMAAETIAKKVAEIKEKAIKVSELIDIAEARLYDLSSKGYDVETAQDLFDSGLAEFMIDNYIDSENTMNRVISRLDETEAMESVKKTGGAIEMSFLPVLLDYLWLVIIAVMLVLVSGLKAKEIYRKREVKTKIKKLERERGILTNKIKDLQKNYFEKGAVPKADYEALMNKHTRRLDDIKNELALLKERSR